MNIPVVHRVEFSGGAAPGSLVATAKLLSEDGTELMVHDPVPVKAGESILFGPFALAVKIGADFHHGPTGSAANVHAASLATAGKQPISGTTTRR